MAETPGDGIPPADEPATFSVEVRYTANFEANLQSIEAFWTENDFVQGYDRLLDELLGTVVTNLERHPRMGRSFMSRKPESIEAQKLHEKLQAKMAAHDQPADVRECVTTDYLVLYAILEAAADKPSVIYLASIKNHKQLSFDFERLWAPFQSS
ncbi:MAG: uncharacterized protein JWR68_1770 [Polaromonas sp.]|nr:uncharacterized protein [Polaromonas sp.]